MYGETGSKVVAGPYYNEAFFTMLSHLRVHAVSGDICQLPLKEIYRVRLAANVLSDSNGGKIPLPIELAINHLDWKLTWRRLRAGGLDEEWVSTQLLALHDWLPTTQQLQKMKGNCDPLLHCCRVSGPNRQHLPLSGEMC